MFANFNFYSVFYLIFTIMMLPVVDASIRTKNGTFVQFVAVTMSILLFLRFLYIFLEISSFRMVLEGNILTLSKLNLFLRRSVTQINIEAIQTIKVQETRSGGVMLYITYVKAPADVLREEECSICYHIGILNVDMKDIVEQIKARKGDGE